MNARRILILSMLMAAVALVARAEDPAAVAPRAEELLRRATATLSAAPTLSFRADVTIDEVAGTGQKLQRAGVIDIRVRRPDRIAADHDGDRFHRKLLYDGKAVTIYDLGQDLYGSFDAPATIDAMIPFAKEKFGVLFPLGEIVVAKPVEQILPRVESGLYLGTSRVNGVLCHHLAFSQKAVDWQLWVEDGPAALLRKIVVTYKTRPESPQFTAELSGWELGKPIPDSAFKLNMPATASKIDFAIEAHPEEVKP